MNNLKNNFLLIVFVAIAATSCSTRKKLNKSETGKVHSDKDQNTSSSRSQIKTTYSSILGIDEKKIENIRLYTLIDEWYGTLYKYGGCDKSGIDCSNFIGILYQQVYDTSLKGSSASIFNQCRAIDKNELQEGDLVFFKIGSNRISHIGFYLQNNKFVHATTKKGVMINDLNEPYYINHFYKAGRLRDTTP